MSVNLIVPGSTDWSWAPYDVRIKDGLRGCYILGGSVGGSLVNHGGGAPLRSVGAPVAGANYLRLTGGTHWLETDLAETAQATLIGVARMPAAPTTLGDSGMIVGNYGSAGLTVQGMSLYLGDSSGDIVRFNATLNNAGVALSAAGQINAAAPTAWGLYVGGCDTGMSHIWDETHGLTNASVAFPHPRAAPSANRLRIGEGYTSFDGTLDVAMVLIYDRLLSGVERAAVVADTRALMAARGITV